MKLSLILAALILAGASFFGWKDRQTLTAAHENQERLVEEARSLGLDPDRLLEEGDTSQPTKLAREAGGDREAEAKAFAAELATFALKMKKMEESGQQPDEEMQKRIFAVMDKMLQLDASQLKVLVTELRANTEIDDETRSGIVGFAVMMLANDHPQAALTLFTESADLVEKDGMDNHVVSSSLEKWAQDDPMAALDWIQANADKHPGLITDQAKRSVLSGTARQDPRLAFQLAGDLGIEEDRMVGNSIASAARTPAERTAVLAAMREELKALTDPEKREGLVSGTLTGLGQQAMREGFEDSVAWFDSAGLTPDEAIAFAGGINPWQAKDDTGKWIDWMGDKLPEDQLAGRVDNLMSQWTRTNYKAAGEWLNDAADGPAKQAAVRSYASTLAPYEPAVAAQWALTLPAGDPRESLIRNIHEQWKSKDETAAADFAREQGLEH